MIKLIEPDAARYGRRPDIRDRLKSKLNAAGLGVRLAVGKNCRAMWLNKVDGTMELEYKSERNGEVFVVQGKPYKGLTRIVPVSKLIFEMN